MWVLPFLTVLASACPVQANCNVIPGAMRSFTGVLGTTDRPFASPGDWVKLALDPACHAASPGFATAAAEQVVTVVFQPLRGASNVVILARNCTTLGTAIHTCESRADVATATCVPTSRPGETTDVVVSDSRHLAFRFPDTDRMLRVCRGGRDDGRPCTDASGCDGHNCSDGTEDDLTFSGPAAIAVTPVGAALPCGLASEPCAGQSGLLACVDDLFTTAGGCDTKPHDVFSHFTALPPPNDYHALCTDPSPPCTGEVNDVRFALDTTGNILLPVDWRGVLVNPDVPVARLLRGSTMAEAFEGSGQSIRIPDNRFLASYSTDGGKLLPIFDPQLDAISPVAVTLFGTADAPQSVLRIARRSPGALTCTAGDRASQVCASASDCPGGRCGVATCVGGANAGMLCESETECPGGACRQGLFDFASRVVAHGGPVLLRLGTCLGGTIPLDVCAADADCPAGQCAEFSAAALDPVPLDGLNQSDGLNAFVVSEALVDRDLNGDQDEFDDVVQLADRATGHLQGIGENDAGARAVVRIHQPPFSFPAVVVEKDILAFLESEPDQGTEDANGNGRSFESILRVFRLGDPHPVSSAAGARAVDAAPRVNGRSLVLSDGTLFYRRPEADGAWQTTERVSVATGRGEATGWSEIGQSRAMSADGRYVVFGSAATNLAPSDANETEDVFVHDRHEAVTELISVGAEGGTSDNSSFAPTISADGLSVAFRSYATDLVPESTNGFSHVYLRDRGRDATERVSVRADGQPATGFSYAPALSADGRFVAFDSSAFDLVSGDHNDEDDYFVVDRRTSEVERVSLQSNGHETHVSPGTFTPAISEDGRIVAFTGIDLVPEAKSGEIAVFVRDRETQTTELGSAAFDGDKEVSRFGEAPSLSRDGRLLAFNSISSDFGPGDTNVWIDVFVRDRQTGSTERVSVGLGGAQPNQFSGHPSLSSDGRFVAFAGAASNLIPDDTNGNEDVFLRDRYTGAIARVSIPDDGAEADDASQFPSISGDGRFVAFQSFADNLVGDDTNDAVDVFVRGPDVRDLAADIFSDGHLDDTVLEVMNTATGAVTTLCPAEDVAVADGVAAFLRPESPVGTTTCPGGSLNPPDTDTDDLVVQLWRGGDTVENLGRAAVAVAVSPAYVAALVPTGADDRARNVVQVRSVTGGAWVDVGQSADAVAVSGSIVAFITPEAQQDEDVNGDGDKVDRVLQIYDAATGQVILGAHTIPRAHAAAEVVLGGVPNRELVAFRTSEAAQGALDLNEDGDATDDVLQVYDVETRQLLNTKAAVRPCRLEACDPRIPYRVGAHTVTFLTLECDQGGLVEDGCRQGGQDLNGDGDAGDLVVQVFNARQGADAPGAEAFGAAANTRAGRALRPGSRRHVLAGVSAGVCTDTGEACATDDNCPSHVCFVPPGGCVRSDGQSCVAGSSNACDSGSFCDPTPGTEGRGICKTVVGPCGSNASCSALSACRDAATPCTCNDTAQTVQRLVNPLGAPRGGGAVFTSAGRCLEDLGTPCRMTSECDSPAFCGRNGMCQREHGTCRTSLDCPPASECRPDLVVVTAADYDGDEILDPFDNCPTVPDPTQKDGDGDGIGDVCDLGFCGNGIVEDGEACDDGNRLSGDGCSGVCTVENGSTSPCPSLPNPDCRGLATSGKARLVLRNEDHDDQDRLAWEMRAGPVTTKSEFGNPLATDAITLCIYDGSALRLQLAAPPGGDCGPGLPCWKDRRAGFRYRNRHLSPDGLSHVLLTAGAEGKTKILVEGRGARLGLADLESLQSPLTVQVTNGRTCWGAVYSAPFLKHTPRLFRDTAD